jgi:hypothetical protein
MAHYSLHFLDNLDTTKAKETEREEAQDHEAPAPISDILDLPDILDLDNFNPDLVFWEFLDFISGIPQVSQGS